MHYFSLVCIFFIIEYLSYINIDTSMKKIFFFFFGAFIFTPIFADYSYQQWSICVGDVCSTEICYVVEQEPIKISSTIEYPDDDMSSALHTYLVAQGETQFANWLAGTVCMSEEIFTETTVSIVTPEPLKTCERSQAICGDGIIQTEIWEECDPWVDATYCDTVSCTFIEEFTPILDMTIQENIGCEEAISWWISGEIDIYEDVDMYIEVECADGVSRSLPVVLWENGYFSAEVEYNDILSDRYVSWICNIRYWATYQSAHTYKTWIHSFTRCSQSLWETIIIDEWETIQVSDWATVSVQDWKTIFVYQWEKIVVQDWESILIKEWETMLVQNWIVTIIKEWERFEILHWEKVVVKEWEIILVQDWKIMLISAWDTIPLQGWEVFIVQDWETILLQQWESLPLDEFSQTQINNWNSWGRVRSNWWRQLNVYWWSISSISNSDQWIVSVSPLVQSREMVDTQEIILILLPKEDHLLKDPSFYDRLLTNQWHYNAWLWDYNKEISQWWYYTNELPEMLYRTWWFD